MSCPVLLGDVGGTNARLAIYADGVVGPVTRFEVAKHPDPEVLFRSFIDRQPGGDRLRRAVFAAAGPIADDGRSVDVTNSPWTLAADAIERELGFEQVRLVNDFAAIAWSLMRLTAQDLLKIGPGAPLEGAPRSVLGPGTGLGVAHLLTVDGRPLVLATEGGHATMAPADEAEAAILDHIRARYGHVSAERVLSGEGLINLHEGVSELAGVPPHADHPETVTAHAEAGCTECRRTIDVFLSMLGAFAGNLALILDARGGVFIAGGIVPRLAGHLEASAFRARFEAKGRHTVRMRHVPTYLIRKSDVAFDGLAALAGQ